MAGFTALSDMPLLPRMLTTAFGVHVLIPFDI
jgi:hypothetical protein